MKNNIITILFLITMFVCSIFLGKLVFNILITFFAILSLREMLHIRNKEKPIPIEIELLSYVIVMFFVMNNYDNNLEYYLFDYKLLAVLVLTSLIPLVIVNNKKRYNILDALFLMGSTLFIGITFNLLAQFRMNNSNYVVYIFIITLVSFVFELTTNYYIGKTIFVPTINPKKMLEGVFGGVIMGTILSSMFFISTINTDLPIYGIVIISFILSVFGQFGDLVFSFIKKEFNKSSFSNYNVGNGGILDIMDSVIFITLGFILFITII